MSSLSPALSRSVLTLAFCMGALGCAEGNEPAKPLEHPHELVGRWVRLRADSTWGDTVELLADGSVRGSTGHPISPVGKWGVRAGPLGSRMMCTADEKQNYCQTFRLDGQTMVLDNGPYGKGNLRRVESLAQ